MERWHFKCLFGWEGMREKKWWGLGVFSHPAHPKCFLPKMGRKPGRRGGGAQFELIKMLMCTMHMGVVLAICVFFVFFSGRCSWQFYLFIYLFIFWTLFLPFFFFLFSLFLFFFLLLCFLVFLVLLNCFSIFYFLCAHLPLACAI